ncbi:amino acid permease [Granulicatella sp. zg-ZJ]|uniref:APC family permease n=1 Tax=Granulicatella sp. zg-ZJ TaxID=2678504 RepID=UPI0013D01AAA|nr:APC family permease [Granulicatella sp. zg-ZJ]NEW63371.1 amino acid permease [Granulicatella sp. zg-ZJ]
MSNEVQNEKAKFSLGGATLYGINAVIGSGIFLLPKKIYQDLGPASIAAMVFDAILVLMLAVCFAEVAGYFNKNGGAFQYAKAAFGDFVGFNVGFLGWVVTVTAWSAMAAGFAKLFIVTFPAFEGQNLLLSISLIVLLSLMNIAGLKTSKMFTLSMTIIKLIPIIGFAICTLFFIGHGIDKGDFTPFLQLAPGKSLFDGVSATALIVFYAFIGFESMPIVAGEMRNPEKNVPKAILGSISIVSVLYILIIAGAIAMLGNDIMNTNAPVQDAFAMMIGPAGRWIVAIGALVSITGLNVGESIMVPRYGAAIAEEGLLPSFIARKTANGAPIAAILISGGCACLFLLTGSFEQLATLSVVFRFIQYIPTAVAVVVLRKKDMGIKPVFRVPFGPVIPIIATIVSLLMIWGDTPKNFLYGGIGILVASVCYFLFGKKRV